MFYLWIFPENGIRGEGFYLSEKNAWASRLKISTAVTRRNDTIYLPVQAENGVWTVGLPEGFTWKDGSVGDQKLEDEKIFFLKDESTSLVVLASQCGDSSTVMRKYRWPEREAKLGSDSSCAIFYDRKMVSKQHGVFRAGNGSVTYTDSSSNGTWVNGRRIGGTTVNLQTGDILDFMPALRIVILEGGFAVNSAEHLTVKNGQPRVETAHRAGTEPPDRPITIEYHRAPRQIQQAKTDVIEIEPPLEKDRNKKTPAWLAIGPSMTMIMPMLVSSVVMGRSMGASLAMVGTSSALAVMWSTLNRKYDKKERAINEQNRQAICQQYYAEMEEALIAATERERKRLHLNYLSVAECAALPGTGGHRMWERLPTHEDFLCLRLGMGERELPNPINVQKLRINLVDDPLRHEPQRLMDTYHMMQNVPITMEAGKHKIIGVLGNKTSPWLLQSMVVQLATGHSYHDVRIAIIHDAEDSEQWHFARRLPHVYATDDRTLRLEVEDKLAVQEVMTFIDNAISIRANDKKAQPDGSEEESTDITSLIPWYVIIFTDPKLTENLPLMRFVSGSANLGFTIIIQSTEMELLPKECELIIEARSQMGTVFHSDGTMTGVNFETIDHTQLEQFSRRISPYRIKEIVGNSSIPSMVTFMDSYGVRSVEKLDVARMWNENHTWQGLKSILGMKAGSVPFVLDISDKSHGPHGLIAGTTGAGKSVLLQSFILSLAVNYSPKEVQFILIDYKGGGTSESFSDLPHTAGTIDDLQGEAVIGRALKSIKGEINRRKAIFKAIGVNNIDDYMSMYNSDPSEVSLSHLIIVVDEFAELKAEQPEFMHELVSVAQIGRSLGVHMVLATQKPGNSVRDEIAANTRFRICLRVASRADSQEMLKRPEAAYLRGMGRCYVQVGNDELFEQVQTSWTGATYNPNALRPEEEPRMLNEAGQPIKIRSKKAKQSNQSKVKEPTELDVVKAYLKSCCERYHYSYASKMWLNEMDAKILLETLPFAEGIFWKDAQWPGQDDELIALYGMADDVERQCRRPAEVNFMQDSNLMISGLSGSGKTTALQTIAVSLCMRYRPDQVNIYIFSLTDYAALNCLKKLPHVGEIVFSDEVDEQYRLMDMLSKECARREKLFRTLSTSNFIQYNRTARQTPNCEPVPAIVVMVDRMQQLIEWRDNKHEADLEKFFNLLKSASSQGIFIVMTAFNHSELPSKYHTYISGVCLKQNEKGDYASELSVHLPPEWSPIRDFKGRGMMTVDNREEKVRELYEIQVAVYGSAESDQDRVKAIESLGEEMSRQWKGAVPKGLLRVPRNPSLEKMLETPEAQQAMAEKFVVPFGYNKNLGTIQSIDMPSFYSGLIVGPKKSGKTSLIKVLATVMQKKGMQVNVVGSDVLVDWGRKHGIDSYMHGSEEWKQRFNEIFEAMKQRSGTLSAAAAVSLEQRRIVSETFQPIAILIDDMDKYITSATNCPEVADKLAFFVSNDNDKLPAYRMLTIGTVSHMGYLSTRSRKPLSTMTGTRRGLLLQGMLNECDPFGASSDPSLNYNEKKEKYPLGEAMLVTEDELARVVLPRLSEDITD